MHVTSIVCNAYQNLCRKQEGVIISSQGVCMGSFCNSSRVGLKGLMFLENTRVRHIHVADSRICLNYMCITCSYNCAGLLQCKIKSSRRQQLLVVMQVHSIGSITKNKNSSFSISQTSVKHSKALIITSTHSLVSCITCIK